MAVSKSPHVSVISMDHQQDDRLDDPGSYEKTRKDAYRKMDIRLLAWYAIVLVFMVIESHNIINAAVMNTDEGTDIQHQLGDLSSAQWALVLGIYHYPYFLFEPFSTFLLKRFSPRTWMSRIILSWGIIATCHAAVQNFSGLMACRFLLGLAEAGFLPGILFHLSFWYPAERLPLRVAFLAASAILSGCFSGVLAFGISFLNGDGGLAGWRWLFIIEGLPAVLCGIYTLFFLPNYPEDAAFLDERQRAAVLAARSETQPSSKDETCVWGQVKAVFIDSTTYLFCMTWASHSIGGQAVMSVLPTVIYDLDVTSTTTVQLLTMPPYLAGAIGLLLIAWLVHKRRLSAWIAAVCLEILGVICYIVLLTVQNTLVNYIFIILGITCAIGVLPLLWPQRILAARGTTGSALVIAITSASAHLQGIVGPQVYQEKFGPTYRASFAVSLALLATAIISMSITWFILRQRQAKDVQQTSGEPREKA